MKKQLLTLLITVISYCTYAQWINQNVPLPYNGYINSMEITDSHTVWGNPWNATTTSAYTKDFVRTDDGGNTWVFGTISSAPASYSVSNLWPLNADTAFAAMWNDPWGGGVFRTYDGGSTWTQVGTNMFTTSNQSFANIVYFWDDMNGIAAGDPVGSPLKYEIWLTSDGGDTWSQVPGASLPTLTNAGEYGITNLFDAVQGHFWFGTTYGDVYRSTDMGVTWTKSATNLPPYNNNGRFDITDIAFSDSLTGLVVQVNQTGYVLMQTTDGGLTWNQITPLGTFYPTEITGIPGTTTFVSGASNATYGFGSSISYDGGLVWTNLDDSASHTSFVFLDQNTGFGGEFINAGGPGGAWKSTGLVGINEATNQLFSIHSYFADNNLLNVDVNSIVNEKAIIEIIDITGRTIHNSRIQILSGNNQYQIYFRNINSGVYFINIKTNESKAVNKIVKF